MDLAMKKAKDSGIGLVSVRGNVPCVSKDSTRNLMETDTKTNTKKTQAFQDIVLYFFV